MTILEFNTHNQNKTMPYDFIGQGSGYKADVIKSDDEIIYIPEYGYNDDYTVDRDNAFSLNDLIELTGDRDNALSLFDMLDWQFPSSLWNEMEVEE